ncbi:MAG: RlmE family RNA methyltransferase [Proteobacteria bacterium]|nr:RlmE family RNA methyltransferase [Pseudomonadota bacterium]MDA1133082.1 RlmE family RNA methyltransferase [Pseudomonadota bacterium]
MSGPPKRKASSQRWLRRQEKDPYVRRARKDRARSRAAYKLEELDEQFRLLRPGDTVVDLGAAPGGWSQVAAARVGARGAVIAVDRAPIAPIAGVTVLVADMETPEALDALCAAVGDGADVVLSDMSPATTGHRATDSLRAAALAELALAAAVAVLRRGGHLVVKVTRGGAEAELLAVLRRMFASVRHAKPPASRKDSAELYLVAKGFRPPE